jgi:hypothetical protein
MKKLTDNLPRRIRRRTALSAAAALFLPLLSFIMFASCDESLPPRDEPQSYFVPTLETGYAFVSRSADAIFLTLKIRNTYTETFSDKADIYGFITIQLKDMPQLQRRFELTAANYVQNYFDPATSLSVATKSRYDSYTRILTFPENEYVVFQIPWNLITDDTIDIRDAVPYHPDPLNPQFSATDDLTFVVTAGIHLYKNIPMLYPETVVFKQRLRRTS